MYAPIATQDEYSALEKEDSREQDQRMCQTHAMITTRNAESPRSVILRNMGHET